MLVIITLAVSSLVLGEYFVDESPTDMPLLTSRAGSGGRASQEFCLLEKSEGPDKKSLISNGSRLLLPLNGRNGDIYIPIGSQFIASCAPVSNLLTNFQVNKVNVKCLPSGQFTVNNEPTIFKDLSCRSTLKENVAERGQCYGQHSNVSIEFTNSQQRFPLINLCHDKTNLQTLMTQHVVYGGSLQVAEISNNRPGFKEAQFFQSISAQSVYSQLNQKNTIKEILDSTALANKYIDSKSFLARGHMSPDGDFVTAVEQNATYYYVNVFPQWQSINNGNWKALEIGIRKLAMSRSASFTVYTGGFQILKLKDEEGIPIEIYLSKNPNSEKLLLPVPKFTWKIVHDPKKRTAIAIVMINNPHDEPTSDDFICKNICDRIKWVNWDITNVKKGYTFCCELEDFNSKVDYAPKFNRKLRILN